MFKSFWQSQTQTWVIDCLHTNDSPNYKVNTNIWFDDGEVRLGIMIDNHA